MAKKRMTTTQITDSDAFVSMPSAAQALYLHLNNGADDDGFNNQVQMAMIKAHAGVDDLGILLAKRFLLQFDSGVIVIKHWRMANAIRKDRYTPTVFQEELRQLGLKDNGSYTWLPNGCQLVATDKVRLVKDSKDKNIKGKFTPPTLEEVKKYCEERNNGVDYNRFYEYYSIANWKDSKGNPVRNWKQKMIANWEKDKPKADVPVYDVSANPKLTKEELSELLKLRGKDE